MTTVTPGAEVARIERALGALLTAMVEDEARWPEPALFHIKATPFDPSKMVRSRADMEVGQLVQEPVYFACRLAVRRLGDTRRLSPGSLTTIALRRHLSAGWVSSERGWDNERSPHYETIIPRTRRE